MESMTVLVVDDEEEFIQALAERLELRNIHTELATTGKEALKKVRERGYDTVLLDMVLQHSRGMDVLREIKRIRPDQPVILLSGRGTDEDYQDGKREGAFDYLIKPIHIETLIERIRQAAESRKGGV
ncbi:MAG: response regulator [Deltaproteobacteria bacterium]|nr:response regulator [Deltaproteobacteria bacterium]